MAFAERPMTPIIRSGAASGTRLVPADHLAPWEPSPEEAPASPDVWTARVTQSRQGLPRPNSHALLLRPSSQASLYRSLKSASSSRLTPATTASRLSQASVMSPKQEAELREHELHLEQRAKLLQRMSSRRLAAKEKAVRLNKEPFWIARHQAEKREALMKRMCAEALQQPITFFPRLPAAAELAKSSWATAAAVETDDEEREAKSLVSSLSDDRGTMAAIVNAWQRPGYEKQLARGMHNLVESSRGMAPQPRHFRYVSLLALGIDPATASDMSDSRPDSSGELSYGRAGQQKKWAKGAKAATGEKCQSCQCFPGCACRKRRTRARTKKARETIIFSLWA